MRKRKSLEAVFADIGDCKKRIGEYFDIYLVENPDEVADIESLADFLGSTREGLFSLEKGEYGNELRKARNRIAKIKKQLAFHGRLPSAVLSFDLKNNHGYRDKYEEEGGDSTVIIRGVAKTWAK